MAKYDNGYSRFVAWVKIILPLVALGLLSTMFLLSRKVDQSDVIPFSTVDVDQIAREQRIGSPRYSGVTLDGAAVSVGADTAKPDPDNSQIVTGTKMTARIQTKEGVEFDLKALNGIINTSIESITLQGDVEMLTSTGYVIQTDGINAKLGVGSLTSNSSVSATGPLGTLDAGSMSLTTITGTDGEYLLVFKDGVKLVYDPKE
ncbi:hypothetical protein [Pseudogemmobacter sp. W21_MBD1_M6]|uniref:hypothetical protein n=1 Tax=Pseudogemmobacter sp. W21_MBD1_M6 TaxID=3240271 RepID=UPI003F994B66